MNVLMTYSISKEEYMKYTYSTNVIKNSEKYTQNAPYCVDAIYTKATLAINEGNPMIEALPGALSKAEIKNKYYKPFPISISKDASEAEQLAEIQLIKEIRLPLPFSLELEQDFSLALVESYRKRFPTIMDTPASAIMNNNQMAQSISSRKSIGADTGIGVTLLGIGGCGKSAAVQTMLSHYPQRINHHWEDDGDFVQLVWIYAVTPANSNLSDLYVTIACSIDDALGNTEGFYEKQIRKIGSVGGKADFISKLIRIFHIGAVILDEIQNLSHGSNKASSFNSLMTIINTTKVALVVVGTEDAYAYMFGEYYIARRTGPLVNACKYCSDRDHFNIMMKYICSINWFKEKFRPTEEILDVLYKETLGVIDRMTNLWMDIQITYVSSKVKPPISAEFIISVSNKRPFIAEFTKITMEQSTINPIQKGQDNLLLSRETNRTDNLIQLLMSSKDPVRTERIFKRVRQHTEEAGKIYNDERIVTEVNRALSLKKTMNYDDIMLVEFIIKRLNSKRSDKRPIQKKLTNNTICDFTDTFIS